MEREAQPDNDHHEVSEDNEAIRHLKAAVAQGRHWYLALLEAVGLWDSTEESHRGRHYRYLVGGEAFDWLLLAERLLQEVQDLVPEDELIDLLFFGKAPINLSSDEFRQLVGDGKYAAYRSYFYGVTVEETLLLAVEEKVRKEQHVYALDGNRISEMAFEEVYHAPRTELLRRFRREKGYRHLKSMDLTEGKEFTYWLFKYRVRKFDGERVASDTRIGLEELARQWALNGRRRESAEAGGPDTIEPES